MAVVAIDITCCTTLGLQLPADNDNAASSKAWKHTPATLPTTLNGGGVIVVVVVVHGDDAAGSRKGGRKK